MPGEHDVAHQELVRKFKDGPLASEAARIVEAMIETNKARLAFLTAAEKLDEQVKVYLEQRLRLAEEMVREHNKEQCTICRRLVPIGSLRLALCETKNPDRSWTFSRDRHMVCKSCIERDEKTSFYGTIFPVTKSGLVRDYNTQLILVPENCKEVPGLEITRKMEQDFGLPPLIRVRPRKLVPEPCLIDIRGDGYEADDLKVAERVR